MYTTVDRSIPADRMKARYSPGLKWPPLATPMLISKRTQRKLRQADDGEVRSDCSFSPLRRKATTVVYEEEPGSTSPTVPRCRRQFLDLHWKRPPH